MKTIMVVDDDKDLRDMLKEALKIAGYQVVDVESGETCLHLVGLVRPDVIILDIKMEGIDGIETYKKLGNDIPVIFHSSDDDGTYHLTVLKLGAFDFIAKPAPLIDLLESVKEALHCKLQAASCKLQAASCKL